MSEVTLLLAAIGRGERDALGKLYSLLYTELHRLAHSRIRRSGEITMLGTTALLHESYLRLERSGAVAIGDQNQFMAYAAKVMRSVVIDLIRQRRSERRGGESEHVDLDAAEAMTAHDSRDEEALLVHQSLDQLEAIDPRLVQVVEMRYFAGMTEAEIARSLGLTVRTVARDWKKARLFLHASLG